MRQSKIAMVVLFLGALSAVCAAGSPKTVDCLRVSVVPQSADPERAARPMFLPPGVREIHMVLTNVCFVDITAFKLVIDVSSPVPRKVNGGGDFIGRLWRGLPNYNKLPLASRDFPFDVPVSGEPEDDPRPLEGTVSVRGAWSSPTEPRLAKHRGSTMSRGCGKLL